MDATILAIVAVLLVFGGIYFLAPNELPELGPDIQVGDMPREGNGVFGRVISGMAEMTWYPIQFIFLIVVFIVFISGLTIYWKSIDD